MRSRRFIRCCTNDARLGRNRRELQEKIPAACARICQRSDAAHDQSIFFLTHFATACQARASVSPKQLMTDAQIPPPPPPPPLSQQPISAANERLWNPNAAALWSVLLSPAFGAFLHAQNWRTLGDRQRARANMVWFFVVIVIVVVATFLPAIPSAAQAPLGIGLLAGWYY